jgi:hypothetical protein
MTEVCDQELPDFSEPEPIATNISDLSHTLQQPDSQNSPINVDAVSYFCLLVFSSAWYTFFFCFDLGKNSHNVFYEYVWDVYKVLGCAKHFIC